MSQVIGVDGGGASASPASSTLNITWEDFVAMMRKLSPKQWQELHRKLKEIGDEQAIDRYKMYIRSYEQSLMLHDEFRLHKHLLVYVPPILIILGTFGNIFSFIILKRKAMLKFSTYFYLMILAIADTLVLYIGLLRLWIGELTGYDLRDQADWVCKLTNVVGYTVSDFSVWLIIAVTIERYIVVCHPLKANAMCNTRRARKAIVGLLLGLAALNVHFFWTVEIRHFPHKGEVIPSCAGGKKFERLVDEIWPWVDMFVYSFIPFTVILVLNALIIRQVILARRHRHELRNDSVYEQRRPSHEGNTRLTVMLLTISFAFFLTTLPMNAVNITARFLDYRDLDSVAKFKLARTITQLLMYVNHSMNFFLYCATGQKFRHQLVWMICYAKRTSGATHFSWGSDHSGQGATTRMESMRNGKLSLQFRRSADLTEMGVVKSDLYTPLKLTTLLQE